MLRSLFCAFGLVVALIAAPVFADTVTETGSASFSNVAFEADDSHFGSVIYDEPVGSISIVGTISNWGGNVTSGWKGLWPSIGLTPTHFFNMTGTTVDGYAHLDDTYYGDTSHQMGLAAMGLVFYQKTEDDNTVIMRSSLEDYENSGNTDVLFVDPGTTFDFEVVYNFFAKTVSASFEGSDFATRDISDVLAVSDSFLLQVFCTNNDSTVFDMGYDLSYTVSEIPVVAGDTNGDGVVNGIDLGTLAENWLSTDDVGWGEGNFNGDDIVDSVDLTLLTTNWTTSQAVPEPGTLGLLLTALVSLMAVRFTRR